MNFKQKFFYMALGCLFTLIGYTLANLNNDVTAQSKPTVVDEIVCRRLKIVDHQNKTVAILSNYSDPRYGDILSIYDTEKNRIVGIGRKTDNTGYVVIRHNSGTIAASIAVSSMDKEGFIYLLDKNGKASVQLDSDEYGGRMAIFNKGEQNVLQVGVSNRGGGGIQVKDKHGYMTGRLP